jgi:hypothetical protein
MLRLVLVGLGMFAVQREMRLGRLGAVMPGLGVVGVSEMGVMGAGFVVALLDMGGRLAMMFGGVLVMLCGLFVVFGGLLGMRHGRLPRSARLAGAVQ